MSYNQRINRQQTDGECMQQPTFMLHLPKYFALVVALLEQL